MNNNLEKCKYIIFLEKYKVFSYFCSNSIEKIKNKFQKKCIDIILINELNEVNNLLYGDKQVMYDNLEYPTFGKLYILFDTNNFINVPVVNYYSIHLYLFKMKAFIHNFLIFLAQSLGANEISWNCNIQHLASSNSSISGTLSSNNIDLSAGLSREESNENKISNDLKLTYDNNGSELFFSITNNEKPWSVKIYKLLKNPSVSSYDIVKYKRNDNIIKNFLENNRYFKYEFFKNNDFLIDFVRKRQNGMTSIHHEILFYDNHRAMFNYYNKLGTKYLGRLGFEYTKESNETHHDKTIYHVNFHKTTELEKITLINIIEEKPIDQLLDESKQVIDELLDTENVKFINDNKHTLYIVLQKYKYYFQFIEGDSHMNVKKITFFKHLLKAIYKIIDIKYENIECYLSKTNDEFILHIVNDILNSIDIESRFNLLINDIDNLTKLVPTNDIYADIKYIKDSCYFIENKEVNEILDKMPNYETYKNICQKDEDNKKNEEYKNIKSIELINKKDGNNYASCSGLYNRDDNSIVNNKYIYVNKSRTRFIGYTEGSWILTSTEWLQAIIDESKNKNSHGFGGFHSSLSNGDVPIALSKWKEYDIKIIE
tara:strand:+ start:979 stop:2775 length:1797 start_codon:yes stop_codon:yes gene_type:complete